MKKIYSFLVMMLMLCAFSTTAYADDADVVSSKTTDAFVKSFVVDESDVLSDKEEKELTEKLEDAYDKYEFGLYIVYIDDVPDNRDVLDYADDIYDASKCGYGNKESGAILVVCTKTGKRCISSKGDDGIKAFSQKPLENIGNKLAKTIEKKDYYDTAVTFIDNSVGFVERVHDGKKPLPTNWPKTIGISFIIGFVIALIIVWIMKSELTSVAKQERADYYTREGSLHVTNSREFFLYRKVDRTKKPQNNGGSRTSSSGASHGGGKF